MYDFSFPIQYFNSINIECRSDGTLYSWGANDCGQLGLGVSSEDFKVISQPKVVRALAGVPIAFIACGGYHSFAVSKTGKLLQYFLVTNVYRTSPMLESNLFVLLGVVYGWGKNSFGQLGLNHQRNQNIPCSLKTLRSVKIKYISCGEDFSVFLTEVGIAAEWSSGVSFFFSFFHKF